MFFVDFKNNLPLQEAFESLAFTSFISELKVTHNAIKELISQKLSSIALRPKVETKFRKKSIASSLKDIFKQLEVAALKHRVVDYAPLFAEKNLDHLQKNVFALHCNV